jgi:calcineurin-like phosphoesterase family protein
MIWFAGDPHGKFEHIIRLVKEQRPAAVIFLGDLECRLPLDEILASIIDLTEIWFIPGNHDVDCQAYWDNLVKSGLAHRNLHGRVALIDGLKIAGLGGVFDQPIWRPDLHTEGFQNRKAYQAFLQTQRLHPEVFAAKHLRYQTSIYPNEYFHLAMQTADVLVTHEAPHFHPHGFEAITELAQFLEAQHTFHGHHHQHLHYAMALKARGHEAYGVGLRGITSLNGEIVFEYQKKCV